MGRDAGVADGVVGVHAQPGQAGDDLAEHGREVGLREVGTEAAVAPEPERDVPRLIPAGGVAGGVEPVGVAEHRGLFREAILDPFGQFIAAYGAGIPAGGGQDGVHLASRDFLGGFFAVLQERRQELLTLVATHVHEGSDVVAVDDQQAAMRQILDPLVERVRRDCEAAGVTGVDVPVATRLVVAMLGGVAIFQDWLFPADAAISDRAIVDEMTSLVAAGLHRPP